MQPVLPFDSSSLSDVLSSLVSWRETVDEWRPCAELFCIGECEEPARCHEFWDEVQYRRAVERRA